MSESQEKSNSKGFKPFAVIFIGLIVVLVIIKVLMGIMS